MEQAAKNESTDKPVNGTAYAVRRLPSGFYVLVREGRTLRFQYAAELLARIDARSLEQHRRRIARRIERTKGAREV